MSESWEVSLAVVEGGSKKFWRARVEGGNLYVNLNCATKTTISRVQFLQDRLRECNSACCMNS